MSINPSVKILCIFTGLVHVVSSDINSLFPYTAGVIFCLILITGTPLLYLLKRVLLIVPFWMASFLMYYADVEMPVAPVLMILRTLLPVLLVSVLLHNISRDDLMTGFKNLGFPGRTVAVMYAAYSSIDIITGEYRRMHRAFLMRGGGRGRRFLSTGTIAGNLIVRCFRKSERINSSMKCRGLEIRQFVTSGINMKITDVLILVFTVSAILFLRMGI